MNACIRWPLDDHLSVHSISWVLFRMFQSYSLAYYLDRIWIYLVKTFAAGILTFHILAVRKLLRSAINRLTHTSILSLQDSEDR
jgi:hypothetical protein